MTFRLVKRFGDFFSEARKGNVGRDRRKKGTLQTPGSQTLGKAIRPLKPGKETWFRRTGIERGNSIDKKSPSVRASLRRREKTCKVWKGFGRGNFFHGLLGNRFYEGHPSERWGCGLIRRIQGRNASLTEMKIITERRKGISNIFCPRKTRGGTRVLPGVLRFQKGGGTSRGSCKKERRQDQETSRKRISNRAGGGGQVIKALGRKLNGRDIT